MTSTSSPPSRAVRGARSCAASLRLAVLAVLGGTLACARSPETAAPTPEPPASAFACGAGGETFTRDASGDAWFARGASTLAQLELHDEAHPRALARLADALADDDHGLPIDTVFSARQWTWEVPLVQGVVTRTGSAPAQLRFVKLDHETRAWMWPLGCSPNELAEHLKTFLTVRSGFGGVLATSRDPSAFAYDVVLLRDAAALVPAGTAQRFLDRWRDPSPALSQGAPVLSTELDALDPAPVRLVARRQGLVAPDADPRTKGLVALRITEDGIVTPEP